MARIDLRRRGVPLSFRPSGTPKCALNAREAHTRHYVVNTTETPWQRQHPQSTENLKSPVVRPNSTRDTRWLESVSRSRSAACAYARRHVQEHVPVRLPLHPLQRGEQAAADLGQEGPPAPFLPILLAAAHL